MNDEEWHELLRRTARHVVVQYERQPLSYGGWSHGFVDFGAPIMQTHMELPEGGTLTYRGYRPMQDALAELAAGLVEPQPAARSRVNGIEAAVFRVVLRTLELFVRWSEAGRVAASPSERFAMLEIE